MVKSNCILLEINHIHTMLKQMEEVTHYDAMIMVLNYFHMRLLTNAQVSCPGHRLDPAVDPEFTVDIARVNLDRVQ